MNCFLCVTLCSWEFLVTSATSDETGLRVTFSISVYFYWLFIDRTFNAQNRTFFKMLLNLNLHCYGLESIILGSNYKKYAQMLVLGIALTQELHIQKCSCASFEDCN